MLIPHKYNPISISVLAELWISYSMQKFSISLKRVLLLNVFKCYLNVHLYKISSWLSFQEFINTICLNNVNNKTLVVQYWNMLCIFNRFSNTWVLNSIRLSIFFKILDQYSTEICCIFLVWLNFRICLHHIVHILNSYVLIFPSSYIKTTFCKDVWTFIFL